MNIRTKVALLKSISTWEKRLRDLYSGYEIMAANEENCQLCVEAAIVTGEYSHHFTVCAECPVYNKTNRSNCVNTPCIRAMYDIDRYNMRINWWQEGDTIEIREYEKEILVLSITDEINFLRSLN